MKIRQRTVACAIALSGAALLAISSPASAGVIASSSFETPVLGPNAVEYGPATNSYSNPSVGVSPNIPGFAFNGYSGIISNTYVNALPATPYGMQAAFVQFFGSGGSVDWTVNGLNAGAQYTLSFYDAGSTLVGVDPLEISFGGATTGLSTDFTPLAGNYLYNSLSFTANAASVTIGFNGTGNSGNLVTGIDNVLVTTSVPEPASWAMFLVGFGALGFLLRHSRRRDVVTTG